MRRVAWRGEASASAPGSYRVAAQSDPDYTVDLIRHCEETWLTRVAPHQPGKLHTRLFGVLLHLRNLPQVSSYNLIKLNGAKPLLIIFQIPMI